MNSRHNLDHGYLKLYIELSVYVYIELSMYVKTK